MTICSSDRLAFKCGGDCGCAATRDVSRNGDVSRDGKPGSTGKRGDGGWWEVWATLFPLHAAKSLTYGTDADPLANYTGTSEALGECDEFTPMVRIIEKLERAKNLVRAGRADEVKDWPDIAALAIGAEALRRRRL